VVTDQLTPQGPEPLNILFAEDDRVAAELVMDAFARDPGLTVLYAADGGAALSVIQREKLAVAVLDIRMPVLDGLYLLLTIREDPRTATLPVVLLTSLGSEADVIRGFELGADDYVVKPFSPPELVARVQRLLGRRPSGRQSRSVRGPDTESP
jgi:DNA-binding response OmpR family regulator